MSQEVQPKNPDLRLVLPSQEGVAIESLTNEWMVQFLQVLLLLLQNQKRKQTFAEAAKY